MKRLYPLWTLLVVALLFLSCNKPRHICRGCDDPDGNPTEAEIQASLIGPDAFAGSGNCESGKYTVRHSNQFNYTFSYKVGNGRLEDFSFIHNFSFPTSSRNLGSLVYKNMAYNADQKKISILISYQVTATEDVLVGNDPSGNPVYEPRKTTTAFDFIDVIKTCDNSFVLGN